MHEEILIKVADIHIKKLTVSLFVSSHLGVLANNL